MQGTLVMLVGLSGLGCHNKGCDTAYVLPTYSSGFASACYANWPSPQVAPSCYSGCYSSGYNGCYGGGGYATLSGRGFGSWDGGSFASCYSGGCYTGFHRRYGGCCLSKLFSCFHKKHSACYADSYVYEDDSASFVSNYSPPVFGSALGMSYPPYTTLSPTTSVAPSMAVPSEVTSPVAPTPVSPTPVIPATPSPTSPTITSPPPIPSPPPAVLKP